jgi:hypothetical protein
VGCTVVAEGFAVRAITRVYASCSVLVALFAVSAPAAAAPARISGKLSRPGYTVIALASNRNAVSARPRRGRFWLAPPAAQVTLHLRSARGRYSGPVVVAHARKGRRAILGLRGGARLGRIKVGRGFARVVKRLPKRWVDARRYASARNGVPIGARVFGRVRARLPRAPVPGDRDLDGIPDSLDIDDDGDLVLDGLDRSSAGPARGGLAAQAPDEILDLASHLELPLERTVNANAAPSESPLTRGQIDAALASAGRLLVEVVPGASAELDCGGSNQQPPRAEGLIYCRAGGTGSIFRPGLPAAPFPGCCDLDGDGFGTMAGDAPPGGSTRTMFLAHGATSAGIATGDVLVEHITRAGDERQCPPAPSTSNANCGSLAATLQFVFATVPALASYDDGSGPVTVSYPVAAPVQGGPLGGPGTQGNGLPVRGAGPSGDGDVVLTLTFWRPQRTPIAGEACLLNDPPCAWIDIGGLPFTTIVQHLGPLPGGTTVQKPCPQTFTDPAPDRPADRSNTFTFTINLTQCLTALGATWNQGDEASVHFGLLASSMGASQGAAAQSVWFKRL